MTLIRRYTIYIVCASIILQIIAAPLSLGVSTVFAAENSFETRLTIAEPDVINPSIPTGLTATAVSSSAINLSWTASTDNIAVTGYRILRDGLFLATTTSVFHSDIGLTASTAYEYTVEAFDAAINLSGQSASATATTTAASVTTPPSTGGSSGSYTLVISNIVITPDTRSVIISFSTNIPTQSRIYWGTTSDYELGSIAVPIYSTHHEVKITGLEEATNYLSRLEAINSLGRSTFVDVLFSTAVKVPVSPLPNPSDFRARPDTESINLSWTNPVDERFAGVRLVRSETFFPKDAYDGETIYEGRSARFEDRDVIVGKTYYYALFAQGVDGTYSSGALAKARITPAGEIVISPGQTDPFADLPEAAFVHPKIAGLTLADFDFIQDGKVLAQSANTIGIDGTKNLTVRLSYTKVPELLKTIAFTLGDPSDDSQVFPFLLRVNADKTAYEATIAPLGRSGKYSLNIAVLDYKNQGMKRLGGTLQALVLNAPIVFEGKSFDSLSLLFLFLLLLVAFVIAYVLSHRNRRENQFPSRPIQVGMIAAILLSGSFLSGIFLNTARSAHAAFNPEINYQGKLADDTNVTAPDGNYIVKFRLYTTATSATTTNIWEEIRTATGDRAAVTSGLFSVMLGSSTPLTGVDFNQTLYLGVEICGTASLAGCDGEMTPRKRLGAVPAAFVSATSTVAVTALNANAVDGISSEQFLRSDASNSTSTATTFLTFIQSGAGKIAEFIGAASQAALSILSNGKVGVGTSTPYANLTAWGSATGNVFEAVSNASTTLLAVSGTGFGTTTLSGLNIAGSATSTSNVGFNLSGGCFAINNTCLGSSAVTTLDSLTDVDTTGVAYGNLIFYNGSTWEDIATSSLNITQNLANVLGTLSVANGGTGQTSFGQGWLNSNGTTITSSTSPTVNYITATSTTATSTFAGNISVLGIASLNIASTTLLTSTGDTYLSSNGIFRVGSNYDILTDNTGKIGLGLTQDTVLVDRVTIGGDSSTGLAIMNTSNPSIGNWVLYPSVGDVNAFGLYDRVNSVDRWVIDNNGNMGVSTPFPASRLTVNGGLAIGASYVNTAAPDNGAIIEGNVGIGTNSPDFKLDVDGDGYIGTDLTVGSQFVVGGAIDDSRPDLTFVNFHSGYTNNAIVTDSSGGGAQLLFLNDPGGLASLYAPDFSESTAAWTLGTRGDDAYSTPSDAFYIRDEANDWNAFTASYSTGSKNITINGGNVTVNGDGLSLPTGTFSASAIGAPTGVNDESVIHSQSGLLTGDTSFRFNTGSQTVFGNHFASNDFGFDNTPIASAQAIGTITFLDQMTDGDTVTISDGELNTYVFEFDDDASISGDIAVEIGGSTSVTLVNLYDAILGAAWGSPIEVVDSDPVLELTNTTFGTAGNIPITTSTANLEVTGMSGGTDGAFTIGRGLTATVDNSINLGIDDIAMTILGSGKVGIGTTSPYAKLSVWGDTAGKVLEVVNSASTTLLSVSATGFGTTTLSGLNIAGSATSTSNVGFNLSGGCFAINNTCLSTGGSSTLDGLTDVDTTGVAYGNLIFYNGSTWEDVATSSLNITQNLANVSGTLAVANGGTGAATFGQGWIYSNGGTGALAASTSPTVNYITATSTTATSTFAGGIVGPNNFTVQSSSGNVGIGVANPTYDLDVNGDLNVAAESAYKYNGSNVIIASTSRQNYFFGGAGNFTTTGQFNTVLGPGALDSNSGSEFIGAGSYNSAFGYDALTANIDGFDNSAFGLNALISNTSGYSNSAFGVNALNRNITGFGNSGFGEEAGRYNKSATSSTFLGFQAGRGFSSGYSLGELTAVGANSLFSIKTGAEDNTALGYRSGYNVTTGAGNILLGYQAGESLTTGSNNIVLGYDIDTPAANSANTLNIGNLIFGTGIDGTGTTLSSGNVGIGTSTPGTRLSIGDTGNDTINISAVATSTFGSGLNIRTGCFAINNTCLSTGGSSTLDGLTDVDTTGVAYGNLIFYNGSTWEDVATSSLNITQNLANVSGTLAVANGGTGWAAIQSGSIPYGNGTNALSTTTAGTAGNVLALLNGVPTWTATSTLSTITGTLSVAKGGTGQTSFGQGWLNSDGTTITSSTSPTVNYITATSTTATSTFAGAVGIGTTNPTASLEVWGNNTLNLYPNGSGNSAIYVHNTDLGGSDIFTLTPSGSVTISPSNGVDTNILLTLIGRQDTARNASYFDITSNSLASAGNIFKIDKDGNVGIGTSSPYAKLSVSGQTVAAYFTATTTATSTFAGGIKSPCFSNDGVTCISGTGGSGTVTSVDGSGGTTGLTLTGGPFTTSGTLTLGGTLAVANGGTGQTSFGQGWLNSNGTTITSSTSPTVNYITATSTTATSTFAAGLQTTYLNVTGTSATSTFARGIDLAGGCFAINGTCLSTGGSSTLDGLTDVDTTGVAYGNLIFYNGSTWEDVATSSLNITQNLANVSGTLAVANGGTGWAAIQSGSIPYGNGTNALSTTTAGTAGNVLALLNGVPTWTATSTLSTITGTLSVAKGGTGQTSFGQGWLNSDGTTITSSTSPTVNYITATSTTATSTFAAAITVGSGQGTSTFAGGLSATYLNVTGTSATSTFARGIDLAGGCFAVNAVCVGSGTGSGTVNSGTAGQFAYYASDGTTVSSASALTVSGSNIGIGTSTPGSLLEAYGSNNNTTITTFGTPTISITNSNTTNNNFSSLAFRGLNTSGSVATAARISGIMTSHTAGAETGDLAFLTASAGALVERARFNTNGYFGIGTSSPFTMLAVAGTITANNINATSTTATSTFSGGLVGNGLTVLDNLDIGALSYDTDAGAVSWVDFPVSSSAAVGTVESYTAQLDSNSVFTIYGQSDGAGSIQKIRSVFGTSTNAVLTSTNIPYGSVMISDGALCVDNGAGNTCATSARSRGFVYAEGSSVAGLDIAETYPTTDQSLTAGDLLMLDAENSGAVMKYAASTASTTSTSPIFFGVVSTAPGVLLGGFSDDKFVAGAKVPVALAGRVPVKISIEGGDIAIGDALAPSSIAGVAMKASTTSDTTIGIALQPYDAFSTTTAISVFVDRQHDVGVSQSASVLDARVTELEHILSLMALGTSTPSGTSGDTGGASGSRSITNGFMQIVVEYLASIGTKISDGLASFKDVMVETFTVGSSEKPSGITLYDEVTGDAYCLKIADGEMIHTAGECSTVADPVDDGGDTGDDTPPLDDGGTGTTTPPTDDSGTDDSATTTPPTDDSGDDGGDVTDDTPPTPPSDTVSDGSGGSSGDTTEGSGSESGSDTGSQSSDTNTSDASSDSSGSTPSEMP